MTPIRFDPEKDLAPMPFDERTCLRALEMKKHGLVWKPHVGCFVWDPDEYIKPDSPFPGRIYFLLSLPRFVEIFDTIDQIVEKLVWLPTWHQARLVCQRLGITGEIMDDRTQPINDDVLNLLHALCEQHSIHLLVEADGSRRKPLKAPAEYEPAIPDFVELVVQVVGLTGLGKPLDDESVHRPKIFERLAGLQPGETITPEALVRVVTHPEGGLKNIPENARRIVLLNQADTTELQSQAESIAKKVLSTYDSAIIARIGTTYKRKVAFIRGPVSKLITT